MTPILHDDDATDRPYWTQHVAAVTQAIDGVPPEHTLVLVGHSGAGPLLPAIGHVSNHRIGAYLFVDAAFPLDGRSRLADMEADDPELAGQLRQHLAGGGRFPTWRDEDLRDAIPDDRLRQGMVAELRPRPLAFFEEPIPSFANRSNSPYGYLHFSSPYAKVADRAQQAGWAYRHIDAGHFHMLVDPAGVADTLVDLVHTLNG